MSTISITSAVENPAGSRIVVVSGVVNTTAITAEEPAPPPQPTYQTEEVVVPAPGPKVFCKIISGAGLGVDFGSPPIIPTGTPPNLTWTFTFTDVVPPSSGGRLVVVAELRINNVEVDSDSTRVTFS